MVEIPPEAPIVGAVYALARRVVGPPLDAVGDALKRWTESRLRNVGRVSEAAEKRMPAEARSDDSSVPSRLAMAIFDQASYADEQIVGDYLGGVLASSKSNEGRDDRGVVWTAMIARLSTYSLRLHYILYTLLRQVLLGQDWDVGLQADRNRIRMFVPMADLADVMELASDHLALGDAFDALIHEGLLGTDWFAVGARDGLVSVWADVPSGGILFQPSPPGVSLYLWAQGRGGVQRRRFTDPELEFVPVDGIALPEYRVLPPH